MVLLGIALAPMSSIDSVALTVRFPERPAPKAVTETSAPSLTLNCLVSILMSPESPVARESVAKVLNF